tara:strand:+ start:2346 stop:2828 length:483 start_codon:yes stop_codon:yes gene_type:complete
VNNVGETVPMRKSLPNTYCPDVSKEWITYEDWRTRYYYQFGYEPPQYTRIDAEFWYAYFLSPVDKKLDPSKIRIISVELSQSATFDTLFINEIYYHDTVSKTWIPQGWESIKEHLKYGGDREYLNRLYSNDDMVYCGQFETYQDLLRYLKVIYDSTVDEE